MNQEQRLTKIEATLDQITEMVGATTSKPRQPLSRIPKPTAKPPYFERSTFTRRAVQDTAITVGQGPDLIAYTTLTAVRAVSLPPARSMPNRWVVIKDEVGNAAINNIVIQPTAPETIDGAVSVTINTNYGSRRVYSNGLQWFTG